MSSGVTIKGFPEIEKKLEEKFSQRRVATYVNSALRVAGRMAGDEIRHEVMSYRDTGATVNEVTVGNPRLGPEGRMIKIGWDGHGSKQRWRLVHLNEFGYTRNGIHYSPRGVGKVRAAYDAIKPKAMELEKEELKKLL